MTLEIKLRIAILTQSILKLTPTDTEELLRLRLTRALCYADIKEEEKSLIDGLFIIYHQSFVKLNKKEKGCAFAVISNAYFDILAFNKALQYAEKAILENPVDHFAIYLKGISLAGLGEVDSAITILKKSLSIEPNFALAYKNIAVCYGLKGQFAESILFINEAITIAPHQPEHHETKVMLLANFY